MQNYSKYRAMMACRGGTRSRGRARMAAAGLTLGEVTVAAAVLGLIVTGVLAMAGSVSKTSGRHAAGTGLDGDSRLAVDEVLLHLRGADRVLGTATVAGRTYSTTSDGRQVVVRVPAFNPATRTFVSDQFDRIGIRHDAARKRLYYSVQPAAVAASSTRVARQEMLLARDVEEAAFTYRVNDPFRITSGGTDATSAFSANLALSFTPQDAPRVFVNGAPPAAGYTAAAGSKTVTVNGVRRGDDVQVRYAVSVGGADRLLVLPRISEVDVRLTMRHDLRPGDTVAHVLEGGARLRNQRGTATTAGATTGTTGGEDEDDD